MRTLALTIRFFIEIALLVGVAVLAWRVSTGWWQWPLAVLAVIVIASIWGTFLSPKAAFRLAPAFTLAIESALFIGTAIGLVLIGQASPAIVGIVIWAADRALLAVTGTAPSPLTGGHSTHR